MALHTVMMKFCCVLERVLKLVLLCECEINLLAPVVLRDTIRFKIVSIAYRWCLAVDRSSFWNTSTSYEIHKNVLCVFTKGLARINANDCALLLQFVNVWKIFKSAMRCGIYLVADFWPCCSVRICLYHEDSTQYILMLSRDKQTFFYTCNYIVSHCWTDK